MRLVHPYENLPATPALRGSLHTHTTRSDGSLAPQSVIDLYAAHHYDFLALTDHNKFADEATLAALNPRGLVIIPGYEVSDSPPEWLHLDARRQIQPMTNRQQFLDTVAREGGFMVACHPNYQEAFNHCPQELLESCQGYAGLEIYNGVIGRLAGSSYALDRWDRLLSAGKRVWGYANDDMHDPRTEFGCGWNMVYAGTRTRAAIVEALVAGRFYASTGVVIRRIAVTGSRIRIETDNAARIVAMKDYSARFAVVDDKAIEVDVPANATYVRFECWGTGEQFAWTQPFFVEKD